MVDFSKRLKKGDIEIKINPLDIYDKLDRNSITGPLRPAQKKILSDWFENYQKQKDVIVKLHTGEGKTLIGLLILQSKLNFEKKPCAFICPNKYLVDQVALEAKKFGIPFCIVGDDNELPNDFLESRKLLISHVQKLFNGKTKFGLDNNYISLGTIILDDSHACIDSIKDAFTIVLKREHPLYKTFLSLFEDDLGEQGEGTLLDIKNNHFDALLPIPYWSWIDKKSEITRLLSENKDDKAITFAWPILKNRIDNCQAFITSSKIEILPYSVPLASFTSFWKADQRILMSATTQDDSFFIKGLGFTVESVTNPLTNTEQKWSGEKMLLIPSLIDDSLNTEFIIRLFAPERQRSFGVVVLVPSFRNSDLYEHQGATVVKSQTIFKEINKLKKEEFGKTIVIVNRYDGIDLPDNSCRLLIIDSMPYFDSLYDRYEEQCRVNSDIINIKFAQKIEQGLGRSVRGEKDYSIILLTGSDLIKFIKSSKTSIYFSKQTKKQIDIGLEIARLGREELDGSETASKTLTSLMKQSLNRDEGWKDYYLEEMDSISDTEIRNSIYEILQLEKESEDASVSGDHELAADKIQVLIDKHLLNSEEKGWYLQILARHKYFSSKVDSNAIQKTAFQQNPQLLKPRDGINYKRIQYINENRIKRIKKWVNSAGSYEELILSIDSILSDLSFGIKADRFENALKSVGEILGFESQRPDKEFKKGPDNLWCGVNNKYFLFECKNEVDENRPEINKHEASQMNSHCAWFENIYGTESYVIRILIIPTKKLSYYGDLTHQVRIMRKTQLHNLKKNIKSFFKEFKSYVIDEISDEKIQEFLNSHQLDIKNLENDYSEDIKLTKQQ